MKIELHAEEGQAARNRFRMLAKPGWLPVLFILLTMAALMPVGSSAETSSRPSPVEVVNPKPPIPVVIDQNRVLVYELHITNFGQTALVFRRIEIFSGESERAIATFSDAGLAKMLTVVGGKMMMGGAADSTPEVNDSVRLDPGRRAIAFMWVELPANAPAPAKLRHRLTFVIADDAKPPAPETAPTESVIDGIMVTVSQEPAPELRSPLPAGEWLAGDGPENSSGHRRTVVALNGRTYISQRFASDWVMAGKNGNTFHDSREKNENFWGYGQPVFAVADGEITEAVDKFPDNTPGKPLQPVTLENIAGNHVIVRIGKDQYAMYAHLKSGSVRVRLHQMVRAGEVLAQVGNSGNTTGTHLHFQLSDGNSPLGSEGVPFILSQYTFLGYGKDFEEDKHPTIPRSHELPAGDAVVRFE